MRRCILVAVVALMAFVATGCNQMIDRGLDKFNDELVSMVADYEDRYGSYWDYKGDE